MSYKGAILKSSVIYHANANSKAGFNLDKWLYIELIKQGVISTETPCCTTDNLYLKNNIAFIKKNVDAFNFNKHLYKLLYRLSVLDNTPICCPATDVKTQFANVYFSADNTSGLSFLEWLKNRLERYNVSFTDPCCV